MDSLALNAALHYFPLLGRRHPVCLSLPERVQEIIELAYPAKQQDATALHNAAHALNKAALLASDNGLSNEARQVCWQHIDCYRTAGQRLSTLQARYMLEPVVNLARLHIRSRAQDTALRFLRETHHAVTTDTDLVLDNRILPLAHLRGTSEDRNKLREWVWLQLLTDGIRALTSTGRWRDAAAFAEAHRGIGTHLMEGRQIAILAAYLNDAPDTARELLHASTPTEPWEHQIASCLEVICSSANHQAPIALLTGMIHTFRNSDPIAGYALFRARLGLTVTTLASNGIPSQAPALLQQVAAEAASSGDGYAARAVLHARIPGLVLPARRRRTLANLVTSSGLGSGPLPQPLQTAFANATTTAVKVLSASLSTDICR
ncbi:hypothetical protein [Actinomadura geliboluensis]|uniref:Uncharacterized protein n=1 Tax=Actinomadura geliboluensis TaxID=882440 RepID=A0A5S4G1F7_9ACTN|nr:hypothetical protein [Actinomadura geliboluensis]TMR26875.1 hypothetical protein ETD96_40375 [Actinomadura geliboluensis]